MRGRVAGALVLLALPDQPVEAQPRDLSGCYQFDSAAFSWLTVSWLTPERQYMHSMHGRTGLVELTNAPLKDSHVPGAAVVRLPGLLDAEEIEDYAGSNWRRVRDDSLTLLWHNGFSGPAMGLRAHGDTLRGGMIFDSDILIPNEAPKVPVPISALRRQCPQVQSRRWIQALPTATCYQFEREHFAWSYHEPWSSTHLSGVTNVIALTDEPSPSAGEADARRVTVPPLVAASDRPYEQFSYWRRASQDSLVIQWYDGRRGSQVRAAVAGDQLVGSHQQLSMVTSAQPRATLVNVKALRVECPTQRD